MSENNEHKDEPNEKKPNETGGIEVSTHLKIYDPDSKEIFVQKRGDC